MAVSGLVITLSSDETQAAAVIGALDADPRLTVGSRSGRRVPLVAETPGPDEDRVLWGWLREHPGIENVEVAFVGFDQDGGPSGENAHAHG